MVVMIKLWCSMSNGDIISPYLYIFWVSTTEWVCFYYSSAENVGALSLPKIFKWFEKKCKYLDNNLC